MMTGGGDKAAADLPASRPVTLWQSMRQALEDAGEPKKVRACLGIQKEGNKAAGWDRGGCEASGLEKVARAGRRHSHNCCVSQLAGRVDCNCAR